MLESNQKFFVVLVDRSKGTIVAYKELPQEKMQAHGYSRQIAEIEDSLLKENFWLSANAKLFTGLASSFDALLRGYPEISNVR